MSVNSIVDIWPGYEIFCLSSPIYQIRYYSLFISPDASYMILTPKDKIWIYTDEIGAVGALRQRF